MHIKVLRIGLKYTYNYLTNEESETHVEDLSSDIVSHFASSRWFMTARASTMSPKKEVFLHILSHVIFFRSLYVERRVWHRPPPETIGNNANYV